MSAQVQGLQAALPHWKAENWEEVLPPCKPPALKKHYKNLQVKFYLLQYSSAVVNIV